MGKGKKVIGTKLIVDENTNELTLVDIVVDETLATEEKTNPVFSEDLPDKEYRKELGKQVANQVLGIGDKPEDDKKQRLIKRLFVALFVVAVVAVLLWTAYNDFFSPEASENPPVFSEMIQTLADNWYYGIFALISVVSCFFVKGFKLSCMCKSMTGRWRLKTCIETAIIGQYYNYVTPLAVGGQPFEIYHLSRHGVHGGVASSMPLAAYFMYQFAFVALGIFSVIIFSPSRNILSIPSALINSSTATVIRPLAIVGLCFGMLMPLLILMFCILPRLCSKLIYLAMNIGEKLKLIKDKKLLTYKTLKTVFHNSKCIKNMGTTPSVFITSFLLSILEVFAMCSIAYFTLRFFGFDNPDAWSVWEWSQIVVVCILLYAAISFIPTPGNSGAADLSFYWLFKLGLTSVAGLAFPAMLVWRFLSFYSFIIVGFIFTTIKRKSDRKKTQNGLPLYRE